MCAMKQKMGEGYNLASSSPKESEVESFALPTGGNRGYGGLTWKVKAETGSRIVITNSILSCWNEDMRHCMSSAQSRAWDVENSE